MAEESGSAKFRVGTAALIVLIVCGLLTAVLAAPASGGSREIGEVVGRVVATVGLPLLIGWVVFRLGGRAAANPVIIIVALAGVFGAASQKIERRRAEDNLEDKLRALQDSRGADDPAARQKAADEAIGAIEQLGEADPRVRDDMQVVAQLLRKLQEPAQQLDAIIDEFLAAGGIKTATLPTLAAVDARLELVGRVRVKAELVRDRARTFVADAEAEMRAGGVDPSVIEGFLSSAREQPKRLELTVALRESMVRYFAAVHEMLTLLREHFGAWRTDPEGGTFTFDEGVPAADVEAYNRARALLKTEAAEQERLEQEIARAGK
jgi:hypothetical protein